MDTLYKFQTLPILPVINCSFFGAINFAALRLTHMSFFFC